MMLVVSDTSPLTALLQIGRADLLPILFDSVVIPPAVEKELLRFHSALPTYLLVRSARRREVVEQLERQLDDGEAEAIALAEESHADYLLIDEKRGRSLAESRGVQVVGLLGVLLMAKKSGQLPVLGEIIAELESRAGFFVSSEVRRTILAAAGEM
ncbi:MAG: DUF3368 domain-containing protein [Thermoguttaceae bacterium]